MRPGLTAADSLAVRALFGGAKELPLDACAELARRLNEWVVVQTQNHEHDLAPVAAHDGRYVGAIRAVAAVVEGPPSTVEYRREYERRRRLGDDGLPSLSAVLKHFDGWPYALAAAGLAREPVRRPAPSRLPACLSRRHRPHPDGSGLRRLEGGSHRGSAWYTATWAARASLPHPLREVWLLGCRADRGWDGRSVVVANDRNAIKRAFLRPICLD
jgi:Homing endonuclease associated repeat